ncbi:hypothetical protein [Flavobacterium sp. N1994]|uniref:hypothetical protein n=1 Tax=Flavobacterium sp. N1994 TaxID=2986827 RepID=UPI002223D66C|nr:hypothetical protein [Flavobacterium sp. N1994]
MKNLKNVYLEHEQRITVNMSNIKTVDLWSEQVSFMAEEHPFSSPAVFFAYRVLSAENLSEKLQQLRMQCDIYLFYETFADTNRKAKNQQKALNFLDDLATINACFHCSNGKYFSEMSRTGFDPVETGGAGMLYVQRFQFTMLDDSAQILYKNLKFENMEVAVEKAVIAPGENKAKLFDEINT